MDESEQPISINDLSPEEQEQVAKKVAEMLLAIDSGLGACGYKRAGPDDD